MEISDREPIYRQIANNLREQIVSGALTEGDRIMSTNEYAAAYSINPATAAKAFTELVADGLVERRRGIGMFVAAGARQALVTEGRQRFVTETLAPAIRTGLSLGLEADDILDQARRLLDELPAHNTGGTK